MSTKITTTGTDPQVLADIEAVLRRITDGTPVDSETSRRIEERAARITEDIRRVHGVIDDDAFRALISDDEDL